MAWRGCKMEQLWRTVGDDAKGLTLLRCDPAIPLLGTHLRQENTSVHTEPCTWRFTAASSVTAKSGINQALPWWSSGYDSELPIQGVQVPPSAGDLSLQTSQHGQKKQYKWRNQAWKTQQIMCNRRGEAQLSKCNGVMGSAENADPRKREELEAGTEDWRLTWTTGLPSVQWLGLGAFIAGGPGLICGWGTKIWRAVRPGKDWDKPIKVLFSVFQKSMQGENSVSSCSRTLGPGEHNSCDRETLPGKERSGTRDTGVSYVGGKGSLMGERSPVVTAVEKAALTNCLKTSWGTRCPGKMAELGLSPRTWEGREEERDNFHF